MNHQNDDPRSAAPRNLAVSLLWLALLGTVAASAASSEDLFTPAVTSFRVYRAIDSRLLGGSRGDAGTRLGNTNAGSAGGVLGYLHTEVVPSFADPKTGRRLNNIDAIAVFEVHVLNVRRARLSPAIGSPTDPPVFGPFMAFDGGVAMPPTARDQIASYGAYVGIQDQGESPRHAYPGSWYSFVGRCPMSPWAMGEGSDHGKPSPCPTTPALEGICPASGAAPDGTPLCQYTYSYVGYVPIDDLVGITSKTHPLCRTDGTARACADYADFQQNGGVEYAAGADPTLFCSDKAGESGLPFWRGRCDPKNALDRIQALTNFSPLVLRGAIAAR